MSAQDCVTLTQMVYNGQSAWLTRQQLQSEAHQSIKKWFTPIFELNEDGNETPAKKKKAKIDKQCSNNQSTVKHIESNKSILACKTNINSKDWMQKFDPETVEDLAVHVKKIKDVEMWLSQHSKGKTAAMLLLTGPVGCGKTITLQVLARQMGFKVCEWITPLDIELPSNNGEFTFHEKQSKKFLEFILNASNFSSLLDASDSNKLILVEDFPNTFTRNSSDFATVLEQYRHRGGAPIVFICTDSGHDSHGPSALFSNTIKEQFAIHHISFNAISATRMRSAVTRAAQLLSRVASADYVSPSADQLDCIVNSADGDVRSAVLNLHFSCLKGVNLKPSERSLIRSAGKKGGKNKKDTSRKFITLGKDLSVNILHGVGRVLNPKVAEGEPASSACLVHMPADIAEQFCTQPTSFVNFLHENYLSHYSSIEQAQLAAAALAHADCMLSEWRENSICQVYGLHVGIAGLMLSNRAPVSAWNPVRGPKTAKIIYPTVKEIPLMQQDQLYNGKVLVTDYKSFCNIINGNKT